jgi:hypothetical protein
MERQGEENKMKRMQIGIEFHLEDMKVEAQQIADEIKNLNERLQLFYDVPVSYLIPDSAFLPPESIRFFYVDGNYVKAMLNGAASIGRITREDRMADRQILKAAADSSEEGSRQVRKQKVHKNHHERMVKGNAAGTGSRTGFLLRSSLVHGRKGISICGYAGQQPLGVLRLGTLMPDVMIGIFDGELTRLTISEPSCGLRFGCHGREGKNRVLSLKEPGKPVPEAYYDVKANEKGRLDILTAVGQIEKVLKEKGETGEKISSGIFAYEFLQAAQTAEFIKKQGDRR